MNDSIKTFILSNNQPYKTQPEQPIQRHQRGFHVLLLTQSLCSYNWDNANSGVFMFKTCTKATNFVHFIHHQFCALHLSPKTCTWLAEQFHAFHPSLHEPVTFSTCKKKLLSVSYLDWGVYTDLFTLRQIEWWGQNRPITRTGVLPVSTLFFWKFCFSFRTSYKELIWCTNDPNVHIPTFCKCCSFIWGCFIHVSILNAELKISYQACSFLKMKFIMRQ